MAGEPRMTTTPLYVRPMQVKALYGIDRSTLYRWAKKGLVTILQTRVAAALFAAMKWMLRLWAMTRRRNRRRDYGRQKNNVRLHRYGRPNMHLKICGADGTRKERAVHA